MSVLKPSKKQLQEWEARLRKLGLAPIPKHRHRLVLPFTDSTDENDYEKIQREHEFADLDREGTYDV